MAAETHNTKQELINMNFSIWVKPTLSQNSSTEWTKIDFWKALNTIGEHTKLETNELPFEMTFLTKPPQIDGKSNENQKSFNDEIVVKLTEEGKVQHPDLESDLNGWSNITILELGRRCGEQIVPGTKHVLVKDDFKYVK